MSTTQLGPVETTSTAMEALEARIAPLRARLVDHPLYAAVRTADDLRIFMEAHVFAVWDFMSLLKALQRSLTSVEVPWVPSAFPASRRFINEIVLGEESDEYQGRPVSHFEVYLGAMADCGASTKAIEQTVDAAREGRLDLTSAPAAARTFVETTFALIREGSVAAWAAAFTFGREDVIPDMFRALVRELNEQREGAWAKYVWYLERHIEVDGEDHGPLSLQMVADLCGDDAGRWEEAAIAAEHALHARLALWDGILEALKA